MHRGSMTAAARVKTRSGETVPIRDRCLIATMLGLMLAVGPVSAADEEGVLVLTQPMVSAASSQVLSSTPSVPMTSVPSYADLGRPRPLPILYASSAVLQGLDTYATLTALNA